MEKGLIIFIFKGLNGDIFKYFRQFYPLSHNFVSVFKFFLEMINELFEIIFWCQHIIFREACFPKKYILWHDPGR